jgi:phosphoglycerate kinase
MANTFFRAMGLDTGDSLVEEDSLDLAVSLMEQGGDRLVLPVDCVVTDEIREDARARTVSREDVGSEDKIVDIGPDTRALFGETIGSSSTIIWNGPMGVFEVEPFAEGTVSVARAVAEACDRGALGVIGGGDSGAAVERAGVADRVSHVSTGGGASLKLLAGASMPGLESLTEKG